MRLRPALLAAALGAIAAGAAASLAVAQPPAPVARANALVEFPAPAKLTVTTPAFKDGEDIPYENTQYRGNHFPGLSWSKGPAATKSYAVIMQDTDGRNGSFVFHWSLVNVPASVTTLAPDMAAPPAGASYGPNIRGANQPYMGPRTPAGPKHHYHLQVFALDTTLPTDPAITTYDGLVGPMKGHILAAGEVVGLGSVDPTAPPPAPRGGAAAPAPAPK